MGISERISVFYQRHQVRIRDLGIIVIGSLLIAKAFGILDRIIPERYATSIVIAIILYIIRDISANLPRPDYYIYDKQQAVYQKLASEYNDKHNGEVTFYHFSGTMIHEFIVNLFLNGYSIRLFVEDPKTAEAIGSDHQADRIANMLMLLKEEVRAQRKVGRISIYKTSSPISVRAAIFDEKHIALGWYVYESLVATPDKFPDDRVRIWGHDSFGMLIDDHHPGFKKARQFLETYEQRLAASEFWTYP